MMSPERTAYRKIKDLSREEFILPGTSTCGGCGGLEALRLAAKVLGDRVVYVNAAGCFTRLAVFPYTPFRGSWLYTTMASAPAGAQGVRDALDVLIARGKVRPEDDVQVVVVAGATYDMGLSSPSGAIWRGLDFWYLCYDNESYGNTGVQMSSATPYAARTQTTPVTARTAEGMGGRRKDLFEIWRAHRPAYLATVSPRYPVDLARKFETAKRLRGPRLFLAAAPCPTGWGVDPAQTPGHGRLPHPGRGGPLRGRGRAGSEPGQQRVEGGAAGLLDLVAHPHDRPADGQAPPQVDRGAEEGEGARHRLDRG